MATAKPKNPKVPTVEEPAATVRNVIVNPDAAVALCNATVEARKKIRRLSIEAFGFFHDGEYQTAITDSISKALEELRRAEAFCWDMLRGPATKADGGDE